MQKSASPTLACGFLGQLVGLAWAAHVAVAIGAALAAACAVVPLTFWNWYWRPRRTKTLTIEIAHYNVKNSRALPERLDKPVLDRLASMGPGLGHPAQEGEANPEYVKRVFGVTDTIDRSDL